MPAHSIQPSGDNDEHIAVIYIGVVVLHGLIMIMAAHEVAFVEPWICIGVVAHSRIADDSESGRSEHKLKVYVEPVAAQSRLATT